MISTQSPLGATVSATVDCIDDPNSISVKVLATSTGADGRHWLLVEERRLSFLAVDTEVAEGTEWLLSTPRVAP